MPQCPNCKTNFRTLEGEEQDHDCPKCGFSPEELYEYEHVYCTNCKHFRLCDEELPYCPFEGECDINDCEDSKRRMYRPCYEE